VCLLDVLICFIYKKIAVSSVDITLLAKLI
jgi:hypothetical protein